MSRSSSEAVVLTPDAGLAGLHGDVPAWRQGLTRLRHALRTAVRADAVLLGVGKLTTAGDVPVSASPDAATAPGPLQRITLDEFALWCEAHPGARCDIGLSSRLVQSCVAPVEAGQMSADELRAYAQRQFEHYFGTSDEDDSYRVAASSDAVVPMACGASESLIQGLLDAAREHGVRIQRMQPWWAQSACASLKRMAREAGDGADAQAYLALVAVEPHAATFIQAEGPRVVRVWTEPLLAHRALDAQVREVWRERMGTQVPLWWLRLPQAWPASPGLPDADASEAARLLNGRMLAEKVAA